MENNIRNYPEFYWITALTLSVILNVTPVLVSFYSFYVERDKFFKDANFRNEAIEIYEKEKIKKKTKEDKQKKTIPNSDKLSKNPINITNNNNIHNNYHGNSYGINTEISLSHQKNSEEKMQTYQNYLKTSTNQLNRINQMTEHPPKNNNTIIDSKNQLNKNQSYPHPKYYSESNLIENNNLKTNYENLNKNFGEDLKNIEKIENELLRKYRREIRCGFIVTIAVLVIDTYANIETFINLRPRFLDTQFILYNNSFLINEKNLVFDKNFIYEKYLKIAPSNGAKKYLTEIDNDNLNNKANLTINNNSKFSRFLQKQETLNLDYLKLNLFLSKIKRNSNYKKKLQLKKNVFSSSTNSRLLTAKETKDLNDTASQNKFIYTNIQQYVNISLKQYFNISNCKRNSKEDLVKIDFIYELRAVRYCLLIINTVLDVFIMLLITIGFLYKVEINKLYKSYFILVLLFLLNKCWSMCAVAYSYFDLTTNECLNAIEHFEVFFYAYLSYVLLFFSLIFIIIVYSLLCRQLLYYILMILVSALTLFIPALFCLEKQRKCMQKIYSGQEFLLKDDLEDMRNRRCRRKKQNFQLWFAYLVFIFILLTGVSALVNFSILKYIWLVNSWRTLAPAVGSITTFAITFFQKCLQ
jgi:hypothetical protein